MGYTARETHDPKAAVRTATVVPIDAMTGLLRGRSVDRQWTAGESNPDLRLAIPVSFRWTSSPLESTYRMGHCIPIVSEISPRSARESNSVPLPTTEVCCRNTCRPAG